MKPSRPPKDSVKKASKPLFSFGKKAPSDPSLHATPKKGQNKGAMMALIALALLALAVVAYILMQNINVPTAPMPAPVQAAPADTAPADTAPATAEVEAPNQSDTLVESATSTNDANSTAVITPVTPVDVASIESAPIPEDPALIREEMDRLADEKARLAEQEKALEEQKALASEIADKKEEQIKLLEQQIALLEKQQK